MPTPCTACSSGPKGIAGHDLLRDQPVPHPDAPDRKTIVIFRCEKCGSRWNRRYLGGGDFAWTTL